MHNDDCGECSYGYNDGANCQYRTVHPRVSVGDLNETGWAYYRNALREIKDTPARYMVPNRILVTNNPQAVLDSLVRPNTYDLFVWIHHFVAKDNEVSIKSKLYMRMGHFNQLYISAVHLEPLKYVAIIIIHSNNVSPLSQVEE